jgi:hypothetical protein
MVTLIPAKLVSDLKEQLIGKKSSLFIVVFKSKSIVAEGDSGVITEMCH